MASLCALSMPVAMAADSIRIGELISHNNLPQLGRAGRAYSNGAELAVAQINASGGINGHMLERVVREDDGSVEDAVKQVDRLIKQDRIDVLTGSMLSNVALAVARKAASEKKLFVVGDALSDAITLDKGNRYTFRLRPSTYSLSTMLAEAAARLPARRWAVIAPNYEYGQSAVANFKLQLKERRPDVEFVAEQWPALGKINGVEAAQAIRRTHPDAIFNATFGADLQQFALAGSSSGLFAESKVFSMSAPELTAESQAFQGQYEALRSWTVLGYPAEQITAAGHQAFRDAYIQRFNEKPVMSAIFGYSAIMAVTAAMKKAGSTHVQNVIPAMRGLKLDTPLGGILIRSQDQQSSMGAFIGSLGYKDGRDAQSDWHYLDGTTYLPGDAYVKARRPGSASR